MATNPSQLRIGRTDNLQPSRVFAGRDVWYIAKSEYYHVYEDCFQLERTHREARPYRVEAGVPLVQGVGWRDLCQTCRTKMVGDDDFPEVR